MTEKRNYHILIGQSGGPTAVINASLYGIIEAFQKHCAGRVLGMQNGIEGFADGRFIDCTEMTEEMLLRLRATPASFLGSCRCRLPEDMENGIYRTLWKQFLKHHIDAVFYIGGNDSMDTVAKLAEYGTRIGSSIRFIGIPKTIDNDLDGIDHAPGYASAAKFIVQAVREISLDAAAYDIPSVTIVEIMGRNTGWLTAASVLARSKYEKNPLLLYLPESLFDTKKFLQDVKSCLKRYRTVVVCVSEGIRDAKGQYICSNQNDAERDGFGHEALSGSGKFLERLVRKAFGVKCRTVELNVMQRCAAHIRAERDVREAEEAGAYGLERALSGDSGIMVSLLRKGGASGGQTVFSAVKAKEVCNRERYFPEQWIRESCADIAPEFLSYLRPLLEEPAEKTANTCSVPEYSEKAWPSFLYREEILKDNMFTKNQIK